MKKSKLLSSAILLVAAMIWGFAFAAQNAMSETIEPFTVNAVRSVIAFLALIPVACFTRRARGEKLLERSPADRRKLIRASLICGTMLCVSVNLQQVGIALYPEGAPAEAHSGFLTAMYILFVPIFGLFLKKKPSGFVVIGVAVAIIGLYFLCLSDGFGALYGGDIFCLICGMTFAVQILCVDHYIGVGTVDPVKLSALQFALVGVISAILMLLFEKPSLSAILDAWLPILYLALMSSAVGYTLQIIGQRYAPNPTLASILMSMESVFAVLGGIFFMGTVPKTAEFIGCLIMLVAIIVAQLPDHLLKRKQA